MNKETFDLLRKVGVGNEYMFPKSMLSNSNYYNFDTVYSAESCGWLKTVSICNDNITLSLTKEGVKAIWEYIGERQTALTGLKEGILEKAEKQGAGVENVLRVMWDDSEYLKMYLERLQHIGAITWRNDFFSLNYSGMLLLDFDTSVRK